jgi:hypothetical protein
LNEYFFMVYSVQSHGDIIERAAEKLIAEKFPNYELVWQTYIGNKGNNTMADLPGYPNEQKRKGFAENSYTVLESIFIIAEILKSKIFEKPLTQFGDYIEFNKAFITVFALLGRMHDTVIKASDILKYNNKGFKISIHGFYEARNIIIHGKKIPLHFDELGLLKIPSLKTEFIDGTAWDDKRSFWKEAETMKTEYVIDTITKFFDELLVLINKEYAIFYNIIQQELKSTKSNLKFEFKRIEIIDLNQKYIPESSGNVPIKAVDVYGFIALERKKNSK